MYKWYKNSASFFTVLISASYISHRHFRERISLSSLFLAEDSTADLLMRNAKPHSLSDLWICSPNDPCPGSGSGVRSRWGSELPGRNLDNVITLSSTMPWMWRSNLWSSSADRTFSSSRKWETIRSAGEKDSGSWEGKGNSRGGSKIIS